MVKLEHIANVMEEIGFKFVGDKTKKTTKKTDWIFEPRMDSLDEFFDAFFSENFGDIPDRVNLTQLRPSMNKGLFGDNDIDYQNKAISIVEKLLSKDFKADDNGYYYLSYTDFIKKYGKDFDKDFLEAAKSYPNENGLDIKKALTLFHKIAKNPNADIEKLAKKIIED